jgi:hypothetical protein
VWLQKRNRDGLLLFKIKAGRNGFKVQGKEDAHETVGEGETSFIP